MSQSRWWRIGGSLFVGLFVAYLDRTNLSVVLPAVSKDMGFAGDSFAVTSSWALTIFLIGYAFANILGGIVTRRMDPKTVVIGCFALWSLATVIVGFTSSVTVLLVCRLILGVAEGIYWPQQSRFARAWFAPQELTRANAIIQYYGQFLALAIGFMVLTPIYDAFGWRVLFFLTGGIGLVIIVPLYMAMLRPELEAPYRLHRRSRPRPPDAGGVGRAAVPADGVQLHHPGHAVLGHHPLDSARGALARLHGLGSGGRQLPAVPAPRSCSPSPCPRSATAPQARADRRRWAC